MSTDNHLEKGEPENNSNPENGGETKDAAKRKGWAPKPGAKIKSVESGPAVIVKPDPPYITRPVNGATVRPDLTVLGGGLHQAEVKVYQSRTGKELSSSTWVDGDGSWRRTLFEPLPEGEFFLTAKQQLGGEWSDWAEEVRVNVVAPSPPPPVITAPPENSFQERGFVLQGNGGIAGADIYALIDTREDEVGNNLLTGVNWSCPVTVTPGPCSLVVILRKDGTDLSGRSAPRAYKVRPPALTHVTVTHPTESTIKFSGDGNIDATVEISLESDQSVTPPLSVEVREGKWETTARDWPPDTYYLKVIQKLPDRASGWIESLPHSFTVSW